jgi:Flp pilus assembly pilin Flp
MVEHPVRYLYSLSDSQKLGPNIGCFQVRRFCVLFEGKGARSKPFWLSETGWLLLDKLTRIAQNLVQSRGERHRCAYPSNWERLVGRRRWHMVRIFRRLWFEDNGQDIAEYAVMLAVILVIVVGTVRLIGSNANNVFSAAASSIN